MAVPDINCGDCLFSLSVAGNERVVTCRRYPPAWKSGSTAYVDLWPTVQREQWCGEWRPENWPHPPAKS